MKRKEINIEDKYNLKNCCETKQAWPKNIASRSVIFVDGKNHESKRFLEKHKVKSFRITNLKVYVPNDKYRIVFADIGKNEADNFIEAMHDLDISMPVLGYTDYEKVCEEFVNAVFNLQ